MVDFIEYVIGELKSKRLSKPNALALVRQFSDRSSESSAAPIIHPLLHNNTSDLAEQRYTSVFTGEEFFLADHQVKPEGQSGRKVLPGVAYLEMARAAVQQALPAWSPSTTLELHNTVWAQPVIVSAKKQVNIALWATDPNQIEFEVYSHDADQEIIHCQGHAALSTEPASAELDVEQLKREMTRDQLQPDVIYSMCARMGVLYGPAFRAITGIYRGSGQLLAHLRLPDLIAGQSQKYVLHPSLMDGALQAAIGLIDGELDSSHPRLPFALDSLRIIAPCTQQMFAWVRYSLGTQPGDKVVKLDIDLHDDRGNLCAEMRRFSSRVLNLEINVEAPTHSPEHQAESGLDQPLDILQVEQTPISATTDSQDLAGKTQDYLCRQLSNRLKVPAHKIDPRSALEHYGIDSILAMKLTNQLEQTFGSLPKTLFFEYRTIRELTEYFTANYSQQLNALFAPATNPANLVVSSSKPSLPAPAKRKLSARASRLRTIAPGVRADTNHIAIIGLSGRYPEAIDLEAYWDNLRTGKDCITEVPKERWDWREYFSEDRSKSGHHFSKWGGFIAGVDEFDPLFFNISPKEAKFIDPQERLFLQHVWMAMEDAGYTRAGLQVQAGEDLPGQVGVYVGVMYSEYQLFGAEASLRGQRLGIAGSFASIANRVSYVLNLHGPSMTVDTMCSSSLTAIHIACQDLKQGRTSMAIAGGVNVSIHPNKYLMLSAGQFISSDGHCQSFGEGGDGYIPGEGVGVVVLKRLWEAKRDGDHIYGIIRGSALNHGGKTNGYTVPNPQAQASVISRALAESRTEARHISYIEAHGTGTRLGDPIEIAALSRAFAEYTPEKGYCRIGSVKSNIGHCESAAGIAGLTKVLLQMQHGEMVPSLHSEQLNPHIDFVQSPFVVNQELREWEVGEVGGRKVGRIAGISSFGAGGSNAHMIVEEYREEAGMEGGEGKGAGKGEEKGEGKGVGEVVIVLSARTGEQLREKARELLEFIGKRESGGSGFDLVGMGYTLQVGREGMEERVGMVVSTVEELKAKLAGYVEGGKEEMEGVYEGQVKRNREALSLFSRDADLQQTVEKWLAKKKFSKLLELWVNGLEVEWSKLYGEEKPQRMSLPTYPFARERYWIDTTNAYGTVNGNATASAVLHPLLHHNTSDLSEQRYTSSFTGEEFFLKDHQVSMSGNTVQKVFPGVIYLEMARAAVEHAWPGRPESAVVELHNVNWVQPIIVTQKKQINIAVWLNDHAQID